MFKCKHESCTVTKQKSGGYCSKHYSQFYRHGKTFDNTKFDFNEFIDLGAYIEIILTDKDYTEVGRAKIDKNDLGKVKSVGRWSLHKEGYVYNTNTEILMHRLVMDAKTDEEVDHKETGFLFKSDNRKSNLRLCTTRQNNCNKDKSKNNTSGYKGVSWSEKRQLWLAHISYNNRSKYLGGFVDIKDAIVAYQKAATELHGSFIHRSLASVPRFYFAPGAHTRRTKAMLAKV